MIQFDKEYHLPQNNGYILGLIEHKNFKSKVSLYDLD